MVRQILLNQLPSGYYASLHFFFVMLNEETISKISVGGNNLQC